MSVPTFRRIFERRGDIGGPDPVDFWRRVALPVSTVKSRVRGRRMDYLDGK